jgi:hypothetical protein
VLDIVKAVNTQTIYEEKIGFSLIRKPVFLFATLTIAFSLLYAYGRISGNMDQDPIPMWFAVTVLVALALFTLFMANLRTLSIKMTGEGAVVGFGIFRAKIRWEDVRECHLDEGSSLLSAANWGVSMGFRGGRWRRMYNVKGYPRVVLEMKRGRKVLVFSTKNPDAVMDVVRQRIMKG